MQDKCNTNKGVIEDLSRKLDELENPFETWQKRLASETLSPIEETEKHEQYSDRKYWDKIVDLDELEKEEYQNRGKSLQKKLGQLKTEFDQTGKIDRKRIIELGEEFEENKSEGRTYKELEEKYIKLDKDSERASSKYG